MTIAIGFARPADAAEVGALFRAIVAPLELYSEAARAEQLARLTPGAFARHAAADARSVIIARSEGRAAGFALIEDQAGPIWIDWYGVSAEARGQGVGEAILRFIIDDARSRHATRVWCDTRTENTPSNALLTRLGFRQLCRLDKHWHGQDYFLWDLSPL